MDTIPYNGKQWPLREVYLEGEWVTVASEKLQQQLLDPNGKPVDNEAKAIDDLVYCYIPQKKFAKSDSVVEKYVLENFYK